MVKHAPHGIVYLPLDPEGEVLGNSAAERILGRVTREDDPTRTYELKHPKGLTEAHGGRITVESCPGAGSTFRLWLPAEATGG